MKKKKCRIKENRNAYEISNCLLFIIENENMRNKYFEMRIFK